MVHFPTHSIYTNNHHPRNLAKYNTCVRIITNNQFQYESSNCMLTTVHDKLLNLTYITIILRNDFTYEL
jgi:hypothetical protein